MKNYFLVLSDIHIRENQYVDKKYTDNIGNVLNSIMEQLSIKRN